MSTRRLGKGRKKVAIEKIENQNKLQVTFSKRRNGLFKKASELAIMTGAEVGSIVFSPGNKVYSFGTPNINDTINKYMGDRPASSIPGISYKYVQIYRQVNDQTTNDKVNALQDELDEMLKDMNKNNVEEQDWYRDPIEEMSVMQLKMLEEALLHAQVKVDSHPNAARNYAQS